MEEVPTKKWTLRPEQELRFEVDFGNNVKLKLLSGFAEIFGTELAPGPLYSFTGRKLAVFTWQGCELEITGTPSSCYVAEETPMSTYLNVHIALEQIREKCDESGESGPRVMVVGPADVGKTTISKLLINYAAKLGRKALYVDLDTNEGSISMPGTLTAIPISKMLDVEEDFGFPPLTSSATFPLIYYYGYHSPADKPKLYTLLMKRLGSIVNRKIEEDTKVKRSGIIINTPYTFSDGGAGSELLASAIEFFQVNVILVVGHERLYSDLTQSAPQNVQIVKLSKSGGVIGRDKAFRKQLLNQKIKEYFYGSSKYELSPYSTIMSFPEAIIRRVGEGTLAPSSALPLGMERKLSDTSVVKIDAGEILLHSILAVVNATDIPPPPTPDDEARLILEANVAGFIHVAEVDSKKKILRVLSPSPGRMARRYMLMGVLKWMET